MSETFNQVFLLVGGNLGNRKVSLDNAGKLIEKHVGKIIKMSAVYETEAWGNTDQPSFLNQVIKVNTSLKAEELLEQLLSIEKQAGRIRTYKNAPRIIDIDILFFNNEIYNLPNLKIPHPEVQNRNFVLKPLNEIEPEFIHPALLKNVSTLLNQCKDVLKAEIFIP